MKACTGGAIHRLVRCQCVSEREQERAQGEEGPNFQNVELTVRHEWFSDY